jgi:hypothetical protein
MNEREKNQVTSISRAQTVEEIAEFWDTHSLADYWDQTHEVEIKGRAERRRRIPLDLDIYSRVEALARIPGVMPETPVNLSIAEKVAAAA